MNVIFHFLFNYVFIEFVTGNAWDYAILIFIFSVSIDLTHIPYLLKARWDVVEKRFGSEARTRFHEIYGLIILSIILCVLPVFFDFELVMVITLSIMLHFSVDFIIGKSMPFYPYNRKEVSLGLVPESYLWRTVFEIVSTMLAGVLFWLNVASLAL